ncbi:MAG: LPS-assembly protein LptD [Chitinophagales bacterium]|nr:LPS-assembly protein LptD [Chitinophagales bacterium]
MLPNDTSKANLTDSLHLKMSDNGLDAPVKYHAQDTIYMDYKNQKVILLNKATVDYRDIGLKGDSIVFDWGKNQVYSEGRKDSSGKESGLPSFNEADRTFNAKEIAYNFRTKKGKISEVMTEEGEGFIHSETVKRLPDNVFYGIGNRYTTCDRVDPDFYIAASKIKVIPGKSIVTGPAHLVIEDVPTPLFLPFGIFPLNEKRKSGLIIPSYGYSDLRGFYLSRGGYYFGISDHVDLAVTGDIYSRGSYVINAATRFAERYKFSSNLNITYGNTRTLEAETDKYLSQKEFEVRGSFNQDAKALPNNTRFSANLAFATSGFNRNYSNTPENFFNNTYSSSISFQQSIPYTPFNYSVSLTHSQSTQTHIVNVTLPTFLFNMSSINPFKRKEALGRLKWYENIAVSYSFNASNQVTGIDSLFFTPQTFDRIRTGALHNITVQAPFSTLKYITVSPSFNYAETWSMQTVRAFWNPELMQITYDTIQGFAAARNFNIGVSATTHVYGILNFSHGKIRAIRHVITPQVGFTYRPDFGDPRWNAYKTVQLNDAGQTTRYSIFQSSIYAGPPQGKLGSISFSIGNNLEMKVFSKKDTVTQLKKIKLLDALSIRSSYNLAVDTLRLAPINISGRTSFTDKINMNFGLTFDPYASDSLNRRINTFTLKDDHKLARLTNAFIGINASFSSPQSSSVVQKATPEQLDYIKNSGNDYVDFNVPWRLTPNYTLALNRVRTFGRDTTILTQTLGVSGELNLTEKWKISWNTSYDFIAHKFSTIFLDVYRDLHCWQMHLSVIPSGYRSGFTFDLHVKASVLQDLKLHKQNNWYDY